MICVANGCSVCREDDRCGILQIEVLVSHQIIDDPLYALREYIHWETCLGNSLHLGVNLVYQMVSVYQHSLPPFIRFNTSS